jgi:3-hydroxyisobutyrate dehydrogenase-like beta-hydroxyacid dehydrogenase
MATSNDRLALLGAGGTMGFAMARNLARAGFEVRAWNRTRERAEPLADDGATIASTPAEAANGADVVITMLSDTDAVLEAMEHDGGGTRLKLVVNSWILAVVEGAAETIALAEGLGLDAGLLLEAVEGGPLDLPYLRNKGRTRRCWRRRRSATSSTFRLCPRCAAGSTRPCPSTATRT